MKKTIALLGILLVSGCESDSPETSAISGSLASSFQSGRMYTLERSSYTATPYDFCIQENYIQPSQNPQTLGAGRKVLCHVPFENALDETTVIVDSATAQKHLQQYRDYLGVCESDKAYLNGGLFNQFQLSLGPVDESTIEVEVDSARVSHEFNEPTNVVSLSNENRGSYGSEISIFYCLKQSSGGPGTCTGLQCGGSGGPIGI